MINSEIDLSESYSSRGMVDEISSSLPFFRLYAAIGWPFLFTGPIFPGRLRAAIQATVAGKWRNPYWLRKTCWKINLAGTRCRSDIMTYR